MVTPVLRSDWNESHPEAHARNVQEEMESVIMDKKPCLMLLSFGVGLLLLNLFLFSR